MYKLGTRDDNVLKSIARRMSSWRHPFDDLLQEARVAYWQASLVWDSSKGASLRTYCIGRAHGRMQHYLRDSGFLIKVPEGESRRDPIWADQDISRDCNSLYASRDFAPMLIDILSQVEKPKSRRVCRAGPRQIEVLRLITSEELNAKGAADRLCLSVSAINEHMHVLYKSWNVRSVISAYNEAMRRGLIDPPARKNE